MIIIDSIFKMLIIQALFQDLLIYCYDSQTTVILDINTNLLEIQLIRNDTISEDCKINRGVRVNVTINSQLNNKVPLITGSVSNFSYLNTNVIFIQQALDPIIDLDIIYFVDIDIYTYGKIIQIKTSNFLKQQSNLEACYYNNSIGYVYRDRIELTINPTGICALQMQTYHPGQKSYLESVSFQINGISIKYNLINFDYMQIQQKLIFYSNLLDTIMEVPFIGGKIEFKSNQGGTLIDFSHEIFNMRLSTIPGFITSGQVGMWNSKFYLTLSFNESLYQKYLDVKGPYTNFKMSIQLNDIIYSFSQINNDNIIENQYIVIDCQKQVIQIKEQCIKIVEEQKFDKLNLDIISLKDNYMLSSMFKISVNKVQTCWYRVFAIQQNKQFKISLFSNHMCNIQHGQIQLFDINNEIVLDDFFNNNTFFQTYKREFSSDLYTVVINSLNQDYKIVLDELKYLDIDYTSLIALLIGSIFIMTSFVMLIYGLTQIVRSLRRLRMKKPKKLM